MMPPDLAGDEIGAPQLCPNDAQVIANLSRHDHVDDRDSARVAIQRAKQCPACITANARRSK